VRYHNNCTSKEKKTWNKNVNYLLRSTVADPNLLISDPDSAFEVTTDPDPDPVPMYLPGKKGSFPDPAMLFKNVEIFLTFFVSILFLWSKYIR